MSTILKALRKLEEERSRRGEGSSGVAWDLLDPPERRRSKVWPVTALLVLLLVAGGVSLWLVSGREGGGSPARETAPVLPARTEVAPSPSPDVQGAGDGQRAKLPEGNVSRAVPPVESLSRPTSSPIRPELPELRITGIAWQENPEARMAIVNDLPVMAGTTVSGWLVAEIEPDGVRFTRDGRDVRVRFAGDDTP